MKLHRNQFFIGPSKIQITENTQSVSLGLQYTLSYDEELPVYQNADAKHVLLGWAWCTRTGLVGADLFNLVLSGNFSEVSKTWCGRWIYFDGRYLYSDLTTSLSMFYTVQNDFFVSSSAALLGQNSAGIKAPELVYKENNFLAPTTCVQGVKQVIIGERVDLLDKKVEWQSFSPLYQAVEKNEEVILNKLAGIFTTSAGLMAKNSHLPLFSALTSGQDSRLDFAALIKKSVLFKTYTFVKNFLFMNPGDRSLPVAMTNKFGVEHFQVRTGSQQLLTEKEYLTHSWTLRSTEPGSVFFYLQNGFWSQLPYGCINIDHCYEIGRKVLYGKGLLGQREDFTLDDVLTDTYRIEEKDYLKLSSFFDLIKAEFPVDRRDLFYLYKSYPLFGKIFQAQDIWVNSMFLGNSREIFSMFLTVDSVRRDNGVFHKKLVAEIESRLKGIPYNPSQPLWQNLLLKIVARLK